MRSGWRKGWRKWWENLTAEERSELTRHAARAPRGPRVAKESTPQRAWYHEPIGGLGSESEVLTVLRRQIGESRERGDIGEGSILDASEETLKEWIAGPAKRQEFQDVEQYNPKTHGKLPAWYLRGDGGPKPVQRPKSAPLGLSLSERRPAGVTPEQAEEERENAERWKNNAEITRLQDQQVLKSRPGPLPLLPSEYWALQRAKMTGKF